MRSTKASMGNSAAEPQTNADSAFHEALTKQGNGMFSEARAIRFLAKASARRSPLRPLFLHILSLHFAFAQVASCTPSLSTHALSPRPYTPRWLLNVVLTTSGVSSSQFCAPWPPLSRLYVPSPLLAALAFLGVACPPLTFLKTLCGHFLVLLRACCAFLFPLSPPAMRMSGNCPWSFSALSSASILPLLRSSAFV